MRHRRSQEDGRYEEDRGALRHRVALAGGGRCVGRVVGFGWRSSKGASCASSTIGGVVSAPHHSPCPRFRSNAPRFPSWREVREWGGGSGREREPPISLSGTRAVKRSPSFLSQHIVARSEAASLLYALCSPGTSERWRRVGTNSFASQGGPRGWEERSKQACGRPCIRVCD